jgi:hypothetical protein
MPESFNTINGTRRLALAVMATLALLGDSTDAENLAQGLLATFADDERSVSRVIALPELGLDAAESPHPAIKPAFRASFEGLLEIKESGTYRFKTSGTLEIAGKVITDGIPLEAGRHPLKLSIERPAGPARFGLTWQSERFIEEPVPPHRPLASTNGRSSRNHRNSSLPPAPHRRRHRKPQVRHLPRLPFPRDHAP